MQGGASIDSPTLSRQMVARGTRLATSARLCSSVTSANGVVFDAASLEVGPIREDQEYGGVRLTLIAKIGSARLRLQVDVGLGDAVTPDRALGMANSRMKDFFDIVVLSQMFDFDGEMLVRAIRATFERRKTALPHGLPVALTSEFANDSAKNDQWLAFMRKSGSTIAVGDLPKAVADVATFAADPLDAARTQRPWKGRWLRGGRWATRT